MFLVGSCHNLSHPRGKLPEVLKISPCGKVRSLQQSSVEARLSSCLHTRTQPHLVFRVPQEEWERAHQQLFVTSPFLKTQRICLGLHWELGSGRRGTATGSADHRAISNTQTTEFCNSANSAKLQRGAKKPTFMEGRKALWVKESPLSSEKQIKLLRALGGSAALTMTAEKYMLVTPYMMMKIRASERLLKQ